MKYLIILALGIGLTLSCSKGKTPPTPPPDNTDTTDTNPPVDTTDDNPSDTTGADTTTHNNDIITAVVGVTGYISTNKQMSIVLLGMSNAFGQVFNFDSRNGSELQMTFRSIDNNPRITKRTTTSFTITYSDSYKGFREDTLTAKDTAKYCGWIVEGVDRKKYGCDRLYLINSATEASNQLNTLNVNDLQSGEDTLITDKFYREAGSKLRLGILNLKY